MICHLISKLINLLKLQGATIDNSKAMKNMSLRHAARRVVEQHIPMTYSKKIRKGATPYLTGHNEGNLTDTYPDKTLHSCDGKKTAKIVVSATGLPETMIHFGYSFARSHLDEI